MPRSRAMVLTTIWIDRDFVRLCPQSKLVYLMLLSQPDLSHLGVLPLVPRRFARAVGVTVEAITESLTDLDQARFIVVDPEAEQVLIRTLLRNDVAKQPQVLRAAFTAVKGLASRRIATVLIDEVAWLLAHDVTEKTAPTLEAMKTLLGSLGEPFPEPSPSLPVSPTEGSAGASGKPLGLGIGIGVGVEVAVPARTRARGSRVPDPFPVTAEMVEWARAQCPRVDGKRETEKFVDYWRAKTGAQATKLDWEATWRNWMRSAAERLPDRASPVQPSLSTGEQRAAAAIEAGRRLEERMRGDQ